MASKEDKEGLGAATNRNKRFVVCLLIPEDINDEDSEVVLIIVSRIDSIDDFYNERKVARMRVRLLNMAYNTNEYHIREVLPSGMITDRID
jgi:hypothetical protein